jgi:hypothetical protein
MGEDTYKVRTFEKGDEDSIVQLFNSTFKDYAGFVPRTPEYWNWCCLQRPDVAENGIIVVSHQEKIVGYAVAGKSGNIWEMCYDQNSDKETVVTKIMNRTLEYLDSVLLNFPTNDEVVRKVCKKFNFAEGPPEYMFISILDFPCLIEEILKKSVKNDGMHGNFLFRLKNSPSTVKDNFYLEISNGKVFINENPAEQEIVLDVDVATLIACILRGENTLKAIATSKIRFSPFWKVGKVVKLFSLLQNSSPWFMPRADSG